MLYPLHSVYKEGRIWVPGFGLLCMMGEVSYCNILEKVFLVRYITYLQNLRVFSCWRRSIEALKQKGSRTIAAK